jgi:hypothetical protein
MFKEVIVKKFIPLLFTLSLLLGSSNAWAQYPSTEFCVSNLSWLSPHPLPTEVPGEDTPDGASLCQFHQFTTEYFLSETYWNGEGSNPEFLNWMPAQGVFDSQGNVLANPTLWGQQPKELVDLCSGMSGATPPVISNLIKQAGSADPLIDQNNNYTFYEVRMNKTQYDFTIKCGLQGNKTCSKTSDTRYPGGSIELKIGWKILTNAENPDNYISVPGWVKAPGASSCSKETLGMVGYHIVIATPKHPEFIWGTFEHKGNNPVCEELTAPAPSGGWAYYKDDSNLNTYIAGKPTNVCLENPQGGGTGENIRDIIFLNLSYDLILAGKGPLSNYKFIGSVWTKDGLPSVTANQVNQKGSLSLANSVAETYTQDIDCFGCHRFTGVSKGLEVSHINQVVTDDTK